MPGILVGLANFPDVFITSPGPSSGACDCIGEDEVPSNGGATERRAGVSGTGSKSWFYHKQNPIDTQVDTKE